MAYGYTLKVYPAGRGREVYRVIEISGDETLDSLCGTILDAFEFMDEHLYEFCMDNRRYSENSYQSDPQGNEPSTDIRIDKVGLCQGQNFLLHYDFGDDWMFVIHVQKIVEKASVNGAVVKKEKGHIEQYPDWDDDDYEEE